MAELYATGTARRVVPNTGVSMFTFETPAGADAADTVTVDLGSYGIKRLLGVDEYYHDTAGSVIDLQDNTNKSTTSVSSNVLTITLGTGTDKKRVFLVTGEGEV